MRLLAGFALLALTSGTAWAAPVTLEGAYEAAESNNIELKLLREQAVQAGTLPAQALSALSPRVTTGATFVVNELEVELDFAESFKPLLGLFEPFLPPDFDTDSLGGDPIVVQRKTIWQANVTVAQRIFSGAAIPTLMGAQAFSRSAGHTESAQRARVRAGVAQTYYGLSSAREGEAVASKVVDTAKNQLVLAERQLAAGLGTERDILQARLAVSRAERDREAARYRVTQVSESFHRLTGLPRDTEVVAPPPPVVPPSLAEALAKAAENRPDLRAATEQGKAAKLERTANDLQWLPTIDGSFSYNYDQNAGFAPKPTQWRLAFQANWLLWDGGYRLAKSRELASRVRAAGLVREQLSMRAEEEVTLAWEEVVRATAGIDAVKAEVSLAEANLKMAEDAFRAGTITWLEVEQARLGLQAAEVSAVVERASRDLAAIQLLVAIGELH